MVTDELQKKIDFAIGLLRLVGKDGKVIELAYSGGKDSDVILQLAKEAGINYRAIYKATTIDPPYTIAHAREMGAEVITPKQTFFQLISKKGMPSRYWRFCCEVLKEYKILDKCIIGVRKAESTKRAKRYKEPTECKYYRRVKTEANHIEAIYPILEWSNEDVEQYILDRHIKLHPLYYREDGSIDVSRRLGCIGCPLASMHKRLESLRQYPKMVRAMAVAVDRYMTSKPHTKTAKNSNGDPYQYLCRELFVSNEGDWIQFQNTLFGVTDYKALLEEYFKIELPRFNK